MKVIEVQMDMARERLSRALGKNISKDEVNKILDALAPMLHPCEFCGNYNFCYKRLDLYADAEKLLAKYMAYGIKAILVSPVECSSFARSERVMSVAYRGAE